ncbi:MAG: hypothetical protein FWF70_05400 [Bacteroidetes bacterium]|nr:hypothetical protein [Bacteroidota bacterium]MCL1968514.1 hypothetical protein [Bacteroidota bacterium]
MKKKLCNLFIILFSVLFFTLSSGIVITWHECCQKCECCQKHQHTKSGCTHCQHDHETKVYVKIQDEFTKSEKVHFLPQLPETVWFLSSVQLIDVFEKTTLHFQYAIPPLIKLAGVNFINFTSQRIFYS